MPLDFSPMEITIKAGDNVKWTAVGSVPHTATEGLPFEGNPDWNTPIFFTDETTDPFQFNTPGVFPYWCRIHPEDMTGTITVVP